MTSLTDPERAMPGLATATCEQLRACRTPDGEQENKFMFDEKCRNARFVNQIIGKSGFTTQRHPRPETMLASVRVLGPPPRAGDHHHEFTRML